MELETPKIGLNPDDFKGKTILARIAESNITPHDCVDAEDRQTKDKKSSFKQFTLNILYDGKKVQLNYLMLSRLAKLIEVYGKETTTWIGQCVKVCTVDESRNGSTFTNWQIEPHPEIESELIK